MCVVALGIRAAVCLNGQSASVFAHAAYAISIQSSLFPSRQPKAPRRMGPFAGMLPSARAGDAFFPLSRCWQRRNAGCLQKETATSSFV